MTEIPNNKCARCGELGKTRAIRSASVGRRTKITVVLCDDCYRLLRTLDASFWQWFRNYCANLK
jgi:hypothetical protein